MDSPSDPATDSSSNSATDTTGNTDNTDTDAEPPLRDPPTTRQQCLTETRHGQEVSDPFRWLESDDEDVSEWTNRQNEYADAHLDTAPRERIESRMANLAETAEYDPVETAGGRCFRTIRAAGDDHDRLFVSESLDDRGRVLLDRSASSSRSLRWTLPGPNGEYVSYGVAGGDEMVDIHVVRVTDGETVDIRRDCGRVSRAFVGYDPVSPGMVAWDTSQSATDNTPTSATPDGDTSTSATASAGPPALVFVATGDATESDASAEICRWHPDDSDETTDTIETLLTHDGDGWPLVETDTESGTLAVAFHDVSGTEWHVRRDGEFRPVFAGHSETFLTIHDGRVFVLTDADAPRKRLLACPLTAFHDGDLSLDDCETVVAESEAVLQSFVVTADHLVVHAFEDAHSRLDVFDHDGTHRRELSVPDSGTVSRLRGDGSEQLVHREESFAQPPTVVATNPETGERLELGKPEVDVPDDLTVEQRTVESTDGAAVPLFLCYRNSISDGNRPTVLHGYGGFRSSRPPTFDRFRLPFLADGGVFAQVCARGGQEYGEPWHEAGMGQEKQHTFDDFLAAARHLDESEIADPDRIAVTGRSNGGLSVGAVVTQAPERFAAAVCDVPLLDMLHYHEFGMGSAWTSEYGDPADADAFETLRAYSPYHNVESNTAYPPTLLTTATDDTRVHPCHARKMAARLQTDGDGGPFLLRTRDDSGHGSGTSTESVIIEQTERWTFLYDSLGVASGTSDSSNSSHSSDSRS